MSPYLLYVLSRRIEPRDDKVWIHSHIAYARYPNNRLCTFARYC